MINALADQYIAAKEVLALAEKEVKFLKTEIEALGVEQVEGARGFVKVDLSERLTINVAAVQAELGIQWILENAKISFDVATVKVIEEKLGTQWVRKHSEASLVSTLRIKAKAIKKLVVAAIAELVA